MTSLTASRVQENSTLTGTGNITLDGAASPTLRTFSSAFADGDLVSYVVLNTAVQSEWEAGIGTYAASTNEIARTHVTDGSNGTSPVDFSAGAKLVLNAAPAASTAQAYDSEHVYVPGDTALVSSATWYSLTVNVGSLPAAGNADWVTMGGGGQAIDLAGTALTYSALPTTLTTTDAGKAWLVEADSLIYVWSGSAFPASGSGLNLRGPQGEPGADGTAATIESVSATPLPAGSSPTVKNTGTSSAAALVFGIPAGAAGVDGTRGSMWFHGTGEPGTITGSLPGDFYIDDATGTYYEQS